VRFSAVGPEIVRGGVLRKFVENKAILRFLAVCQDTEAAFYGIISGTSGLF